MTAPTVIVHPSQFPDAVQNDLLNSLRSREVNHKFHYVSYRQAEKWLAVHEGYSPARKDPDCKAIYEKAFAAAAKLNVEQVIGLGCGGGQKDVRLLAKLARKKVGYVPMDVSLPLVITAWQRALEVMPEDRLHGGVVCDLLADDVPRISNAPALVGFFGMLPNFEPNAIMPRVAAFLARKDYLLCSANLAPGADYPKGVQTVLPQYENPPTHDWLVTLLMDLGVPKEAGIVEWKIEPSSGLLRITGHFRFSDSAEIIYAGNRFNFKARDTIRLFFSYRYTPYLLEKLLASQGIKIKNQWITRSGEEGVFLCQKA